MKLVVGVHDSPYPPDAQIGSESRPDCYLCGTPGLPIYQGLRDRLFGVWGEWSFKRCQNSGCGLVWLDPMPTEADLGKAYQSYYTHAEAGAASPDHPGSAPGLIARIVRKLHWRLYWHPYWRLRWAVQDGYLQTRFHYSGDRRWHRYLAPMAHLYPSGRAGFEAVPGYLTAPRAGARLLEVGSGSGDQLALMRRLGWEAEGVDFDPFAVQAATSKGLPVRLGTLAEQAFPECHFDAIYMSHVIEHVHDPVGLLRECRRLLRADGVLVAVTPNVQSWGHRHFGPDWLHLDPPRHLMLFSAGTLLTVARKAGLAVTSLRRSAHCSAHMWDKSLELRRRGATSIRRPTADSSPAGVLFQLMQRVLRSADPRSGEEIVLIARKRPDRR